MRCLKSGKRRTKNSRTNSVGIHPHFPFARNLAKVAPVLLPLFLRLSTWLVDSQRGVSASMGKASLTASFPVYILHWSLFILSEFDDHLSYTLNVRWDALTLLLYTLRFEKAYDPIHVLNWMRDHPMVPVYACLVYVALIFGGQHIMKDRQAWNWRHSMAMWNLSLSVFSWIGMARTAPQLAHNLYYMSIRDNLCLDPRATYGSGSSGLWVQLFILSKFP
jgi:hypothetical protein